MRVAHLSLSDFRNYHSAELTLRPGANLLLGKNGQGKTNLIEAIAYFATLRSHRVAQDAAMIKKAAPYAIMRMRINARKREVTLEAQLQRNAANKTQLNGNQVSARELTRWFAAVVFAPEDLNIVRGEPAQRRKFLDDALSTRLPSAAGVLADYERVVRQRTTLLKSLRAQNNYADAAELLAPWDKQLIALGSKIMLARRDLLCDLQNPVAKAYKKIAGAEHGAQLSLSESINEFAENQVSRETLEAEFKVKLDSLRRKEIERGVTLIGPHRDDLFLQLKSLPVKGYASHGETWSFALALKLALANVLREESPAGDPVIILDDVFAELDRMRRQKLLEMLGDFEQIIVTAAVAADVPKEITWHTVLVADGKLRPIKDAHSADSNENSAFYLAESASDA